jgi:hypothetical protein
MMSKLKLILVIIPLISTLSVKAQDLGPIPAVDVSQVDWNEIYGMVEPGDTKGLLDLLGMFDGLADGEVPSPKLSDFFKRDKKRRKYSMRETAGWLTNFVLSGRLSAYMDKAHNVYILLSDDEKKLHEKFFDSYVIVGAEIIGGPEVTTFIANSHNIINKINAIKELLNNNKDILKDEELISFIQVLNTIISAKKDQMTEFQMLTTDNVLVATPAQRKELIIKLNDASTQVDNGLGILYNQIIYLVMQRTDEQIVNETIEMMLKKT